MSAILYWLAVRLYVSIIRIASIFNPKARLFLQGRVGLLNTIKYALIDEQRPRIWIHCASLGEFEQGRPVIEHLREKYANYVLVLTFFSPSGYELRKDFEGVDHVFYLPVDSVSNAKKFLDYVQPELSVFVKYELWYYYLSNLAKRDMPTLLVAAIFRKNQPFFQWYGKLHRRMLHSFTHIFVQDDNSLKLLNTIGYTNASVGGDTRFDRVVSAQQKSPFEHEILEQFTTGKKVLVAGSTWPADERVLKQIAQQIPEQWKIVLVPHEVHEAHLENIETDFKGKTIRWSQWDSVEADKQVLIVDKMGLLLRLYQIADVAWIGGGVGKTGLHNTLEAAVYGVPIVHGENYRKFKEARELIEAGASFVVNSPSAFITLIEKWEADNVAYNQACVAAKNYVLSNAGATAHVVDYIEEKKLLIES